MDFMAGLFTGIAFWPVLILLVWNVCTVVLVENESPFWAFGLMLLAGVAITFTSDSNPFWFILQNPVTVFILATLYFPAGGTYSYLRWKRHLIIWRRKYDAMPEGREKRHMYENQPDHNQSKGTLITWMVFWPWSLFWYVCANFITDAFEWLYQKMSGLFAGLTKKHLAGLAPPQPEPEADPKGGRRRGDVLSSGQGGVDHPAG